jgi:transposase
MSVNRNVTVPVGVLATTLMSSSLPLGRHYSSGASLGYSVYPSARWLSEHPGVEVVSRDRGGEYAEAARRATPHAVQVADRFHLLKNLGDVVSRVFRQHEEVLDLVPTPAHHLQRLTNLRLDREASKERTREKARELFESIHALSKKGMKNAQVARELGIHRHTVEKCLTFKSPPQRRHFTKKVSAIAPYEYYILGALGAGLSQRHPNLAGDLRAGLPGCLQECR